MTIGILRVSGNKQLASNKKKKKNSHIFTTDMALQKKKMALQKRKLNSNLINRSNKSDNCSLIRKGEDYIGIDGDPRVHRNETKKVKS